MHEDGVWTYRPRSAVAVTAGFWLLAVGLATAQGLAYGAGALLRALPVTLAVALLAWMSFYHPHVRVDDDGVLVVNPVRRFHVPWPALVEITTRYTCTLVTPHRKVEAFAAPGPGRQATAVATVVDLRGADRRRPLPVGELPSAASGQVAGYLRHRWGALVEAGAIEAGVADETPVTVRTDLVPLLALGVLGVAAVLVLLV